MSRRGNSPSDGEGMPVTPAHASPASSSGGDVFIPVTTKSSSLAQWAAIWELSKFSFLCLCVLVSLAK